VSRGTAREAPVERLQRTLARVGFGSRRSAEQLIAAGRVRVDGRVAELGDRVDPTRAVVTVDGVPIPTDPELRYFAFNKPSGVTTTMSDPHAERSLGEFLPPGPRVFPVGRLDRDSEGLLLMTNDGELANRLQHPRYGIEKEYLVEVNGALPKSAVARLRDGVRLDDGVAKAVRVGTVQRAGERSALAIVMGEGRKREVRRMLAAIGYPVGRLVRVRLGPVRLGSLRPGQVKPLLPDEVTELYRVTGLDRARRGEGRGGAARKGEDEQHRESRSRVRRPRRPRNST
jgi:23S rRNA pseudouridine2605 synthase